MGRENVEIMFNFHDDTYLHTLSSNDRYKCTQRYRKERNYNKKFHKKVLYICSCIYIIYYNIPPLQHLSGINSTLNATLANVEKSVQKRKSECGKQQQ